MIKKFINRLKSNHGFSLIEVLIALSIFAVFATAFISSQGSNVADSGRIDEENLTHQLCEMKLNEIILNPPEFRESLTLSKETKGFEGEEIKDYEFTIEYRRLKIPNFAKIAGESGDEGAASSSAQGKIFDLIKKNIEEMIWQISVTVRNKNTDYQFTLTTWLENTQAKVAIQ